MLGYKIYGTETIINVVGCAARPLFYCTLSLCRNLFSKMFSGIVSSFFLLAGFFVIVFLLFNCIWQATFFFVVCDLLVL